MADKEETACNPWRTFSIFISSTFADMQAERDYLNHYVFPRLEDELVKRRIHLEVVDLRWGIDTTKLVEPESREKHVLKVCMDEIRRCHPFFIGLLGDRYGWIPPEERMSDALRNEHTFPTRSRISVTELEIEFGVLASEAQLTRSVFYFREPLPYDEMPSDAAARLSDARDAALNESEKTERIAALRTLKNAIRMHYDNAKLSDKVKTYHAVWNPTLNKVTGLEEWGEVVYHDVLAECEIQADETQTQLPRNWLQQEKAHLDVFTESHALTFCGRTALLEELTAHLLEGDDARWGLVLTGESGSGKSSVFSKLYAQLKKHHVVLAHSAGLSPRAKSVANLLRLWNRKLRTVLGHPEEPVEEEENEVSSTKALAMEKEADLIAGFEKLQHKFRTLLAEAAGIGRVVLLIDALDRFERTERAQYVSWLPSIMPPNVRLICTALPGAESNAVRHHAGLATKPIDEYSRDEACEMLLTLCTLRHKKLPEMVVASILDKKREDGKLAASLPLWLSIAVNVFTALDEDDFREIARREGRPDIVLYDFMNEKAKDFPPLPGPLFLDLLKKAGTVFGGNLTASTFEYIACSRAGLRENDLAALLKADDVPWDSLRFANLRRWFKSHLVLQGQDKQWNLEHSVLRLAVQQQMDAEGRRQKHAHIADHLISGISDSMKVTEAMYHLIRAGKLRKAAAYYGGKLTTEERSGATRVLADEIREKDENVVTVACIPCLAAGNIDLFRNLLSNYIYCLDDELAVEGYLPERLHVLTETYEVWKENFGRSIPDADFASDIAGLFEKIGRIHQARGEYEKALGFFIKENCLFECFAKIYQDNKRIITGLAISYTRLGDIYQELEEYEQALDVFQKDLQLSQRLYAAEPGNAVRKNSLAISYEEVGAMLQKLKRYDEARQYFTLEVKMAEELWEADKTEIWFRYALAAAYTAQGDFCAETADADKAEEYFKALTNYEKSTRLLEELRDILPQYELIKYWLAVLFGKYANLYSKQGAYAEANMYETKKMEQLKKISSENPYNFRVTRELASSYVALGNVLSHMTRNAEAHEVYEQGIAILKRLHSTHSPDLQLKQRLATGYLRNGELYQQEDRFENAVASFKEESHLIHELYAKSSHREKAVFWLMESYVRRAICYQALGQFNNALDVLGTGVHFIEDFMKKCGKSSATDKLLNFVDDALGSAFQAVMQSDQYRAFEDTATSSTTMDAAQKSHIEMVIYQLVSRISSLSDTIEVLREA